MHRNISVRKFQNLHNYGVEIDKFACDPCKLSWGLLFRKKRSSGMNSNRSRSGGLDRAITLENSYVCC